MTNFDTTKQYREFIQGRKTAIETDLRSSIIDMLNIVGNHDPNFKGYGVHEGHVVVNFKDGIGFKITVELDHQPMYLPEDQDFNDAEREDH